MFADRSVMNPMLKGLKISMPGSHWLRKDRVARGIALLFIAALFAWVISGIVNTITSTVLYKPPAPMKAINPAEIKRNRQPKSMDSYAVIADRDLMKIARVGPDASGQLSVEEMQTLTGMGLILKGTITGPVSVARAIIEEKSTQRLYHIGDTIGGGILTSIFRDWIVLTVSGRKAMLALQFDRQGKQSAGKTGEAGYALAFAGPLSKEAAREIQRTDHTVEQIRKAQELSISRLLKDLPPEEKTSAIERANYTLEKIREAQELSRSMRMKHQPQGPVSWDRS